ncbi:MAG: sulfurtransferase complex subunit TusB [Nitrosomonadales bacterium]|nr:sulfurtransferase complex subunit TusB [Nitrosomonadales bacterium]
MLHIINQSPLNSSTLDSCLNTATGGEILLIEDAVYAATRGNAAEAKLRAAMGKFKVYVLTPDLDARGLGDRVVEGVSSVDYGGFVDLVSNSKNCQSWL